MILRRFREDDADALFRAVTESREHLCPWLPWAATYTRESAILFLTASDRDWADGTAFNYAITADGVLAGRAALTARIGPGGLEIGYWIHRDHVRRGLATTTARALTAQAFRLPGIERVEIIHNELNVAVGAVPRKLGFTQAGRQPVIPPSALGNSTGIIWRLTRQDFCDAVVS